MNLKQIRWYLVVVLFGAGLFYGGYRYGEWRTENSFEEGVPFKLDLLKESVSEIRERYLKTEDIKSEKMMYGAISGLTASLGDPYTSFYTPTENERSEQDLAGEFGGVGIQLGYIEDTLAVMAPMKDTPAFRAGLKAGDWILKIEDKAKGVSQDTTGIKLDEAVNLIRGTKGSEVSLTILRKGEKEMRQVSLIREVINVPSTELSWLDNNQVAMVRVNKFGDNTLTEWNKIVAEIKSKNARGMILDLRDNPGGYLQRAVDLGSDFIKDGVILKQRERFRTETLNVNRSGRLLGLDLVVLINGGSASASEILAGALRERLGIKLVGEKSFGKGTVQEAVSLSNGSGLHITIAEWLLPSGVNIHGKGLEPDVAVEYEYNEKMPEYDNQVQKALMVLKEKDPAI